MALTIPTIKAAIKAKRELALGPPTNAALADKIYQADAEWIFEVLTVQASTLLTNGIDTGGDSLVSLTGTLV